MSNLEDHLAFHMLEDTAFDKLGVFAYRAYGHYVRCLADGTPFAVNLATAAACRMSLSQLRRSCKECYEAGYMPQLIKEQDNQSKHIYLISDGQGHFKIGIADDPQQRRIELQSGNPHPLEIIYSHFCNNTSVIERQLHEQYKTKRMTGEWFALDQADVLQVIKVLGEL